MAQLDLYKMNEQISEYGLIIENGRVLVNGEEKLENLPIAPHGKIISSDHQLNKSKALRLDAKGKIILPGAVDIHVHARDGVNQSYKEDWKSLSMAALAGGVTTAFGMPNTNPITDTVHRLRQRFGLARKKSLINYSEYIGTLGDNVDDLTDTFTQTTAAGVKIYLNETTGGFTIGPEAAFKLASRIHPSINRLTFVLHAEGETLQKIAPALLELGHQVHVAHISLASEVQLVEALRAKGWPITAEVTPHHLLISVEDVRENVRADLCELCVMKPPLSPKEDLPALHHGLKSGAIVAIATDHAPHTKKEKEENLKKNQKTYGVTGLQEMLPLMMTHLRNDYSLAEISNYTSTSPAKHAGIENRGQIKNAHWADLAVIDPDFKYALGDQQHPFYSRAGWSIYQDWPVETSINATFVNGQIAYWAGQFTDRSSARQVKFKR